MDGQNALKTKKFQTEVHLSREMTLMDATLIGVGAMIGAGIFVLTGIAAGVAGPALILTFALNGIVALLTAMAYAELGSCFHDAGGGGGRDQKVRTARPRRGGFPHRVEMEIDFGCGGTS